MTRITLALLCGWAGHGGKVETTIGIVAKHREQTRSGAARAFNAVGVAENSPGQALASERAEAQPRVSVQEISSAEPMA